jgi:hypothetical protein
LDCLRLGRRCPDSHSQALKQAYKPSWERIPNKLSQQTNDGKGNSPSTCIFSDSRVVRAVAAACCSSWMTTSFSSLACHKSL